MTSHSLKAVNSNVKLPTAQTEGTNVKLIEPSENQPLKLKQLLPVNSVLQRFVSAFFFLQSLSNLFPVHNYITLKSLLN